MLKASGYTDLRTVSSAQDVFLTLKLDTPDQGPNGIDLILMDVMMPEIGGIEACQRLKAASGLQDLPIIMVTASTEEEDLQAAFAAGAMDYITKPPKRSELLARVSSALKLKSEMDRRKAREQELVELSEQLQGKNRQLVDMNKAMEKMFDALAEHHSLLQVEQSKSERLLLNILPAPIAARLKQHEGPIADQPIADSFPEATVLFADIVDFTPLSARMKAEDLVWLLNDVFSVFDSLAEKHSLEKIKTIGDAYMVVGGVPTPRADHAEAVAAMALDMRANFSGRKSMSGRLLSVRIGIHTGPVVAGVIGHKKFIYDLWGDTVNLASRMETHSLPGQIQVSPETYQLLKGRFTFEARGPMTIKGRGEMTPYFLLERA